MTDQQLQAIKERVAAATPGEWKVSVELTTTCPVDKVTGQVYVAEAYRVNDALFLSYAKDDVTALITEVERLRKEVHGHEQSLLHDTYSEFTAKREIERLREALTAVNSTIGTYLKAYHYPVYEQMAQALEGADDTCI